MPSSTEPNFGIKHSWAVGESYKPEMDANLKKLGALFFCSVKNTTTTAQPGSPAEGDRYIVGASATGAWSGKDNQIAVFANAAWLFYAPAKGWLVRDEAIAIGTAGCFKTFDGTNWISVNFGIAAGAIDNSHIAAGASIALSKLATMTANRVAVSGAGGLLEAATATKDQVNALAGRGTGRIGFFDGSALLSDSANGLLDSGGNATFLGTLKVGTSIGTAKLLVQATGTTSQDIAFFERSDGVRVVEYVTNGGGHGAVNLRNSSGTQKVLLNSGGDSYFTGGRFGIGDVTGPDAALHVAPITDVTVGLIIRGISGYAADFIRLQDNSSNNLRKFNAAGRTSVSGTLTAGGATGAQTINKPSGRVNFEAGATSLVVTCNQCNANCKINPEIQTNDSTMKSVIAVPAAGSFTLYPNAAPTAETAVFFEIVEIV